MFDQEDFLERHEKFIAFMALGMALVGLCVMVYLRPPSAAILQNGAALAILNTIVGALTLAFGGAANALFKISQSEKNSIGQAAANAVANNPPAEVTVKNSPAEPVPTTEAQPETSGVPPMFKEEGNG